MPLVTKSFANAVSFTRASNATYFDSSGLLKRAASNVSRIDYNPSTLAVRGLLVEEQRTNLLVRSEDFTTNWGPVAGTVRANATTAPSGAASADAGESNGTNFQVHQGATIASGATISGSVFLKANGINEIEIVLCTEANITPYARATFNVLTGVISVAVSTNNGGTNASASITSVNNGWYRCVVTVTYPATTSAGMRINAQGATGGIFLWGAQLEAGAFATSYIPSSVTFSGRTSSGTYFDSAGVLQTAGSGVSRTTYNPSNLTADPFLLLEESRTNSIRNNTMVGAVAGSPGTLPTNWGTALASGISVDVASTGTEAGISYIDLTVSGTAGATQNIFIAFETASTISALQNQTWTHCFYIKNSTTATLPNNIAIGMRTYNSSGGLISAIGAIATVATSSQSLATTRQSYSATLSGATVAYVRPTLEIPVTSGVTYNFTLRIGMPQLEQGAFATSVISTSSAAVTRAADTSTSATTTRAVDNAIVNVNRWFYDTEGTIYIEAAIEGVGSPNYLWSIAVDDGTGSNRYGFYFNDAGGDSYNKKMLTNEVGQIEEAGPVTLVANTFIKSAMAVKTNDLAAAYNGGNLQTDTSVNIPKNLTRLSIGRGDSTWSGWIKSVKYYPRRLSNAELITLTT